MADITGNLQKILVEETDFNSPVSEQLGTKYGASINAIIDLVTSGWTLFTSNTTWTAPDDATRIDLIGVGGGAGGGGGVGAWGGPGGTGVTPFMVTESVTPSVTYNIVIGAAGAGAVNTGVFAPGGNGGATTFGTAVSFSGGVNSAAVADYNGQGTLFNKDNKSWLYQGLTMNMGGGTGASGTRNPYAAGGVGSSGSGGGASFGAGGAGAAAAGNGVAAAANSGGGGGGSSSTVATSGAAGGTGVLLLRLS